MWWFVGLEIAELLIVKLVMTGTYSTALGLEYPTITNDNTLTAVLLCHLRVRTIEIDLVRSP